MGEKMQVETVAPISEDLQKKIKEKATSLGIDPALACALVEQESGGNPWSIRYEPDFYRHYVASQQLNQTEKMARSISWGLFQTMGQSVREAGYKGDMAQLCDEDTGITWGLAVFQKKLSLARGEVSKALLFWNGGGNPNYPAEVLARVPKYVDTP